MDLIEGNIMLNLLLIDRHPGFRQACASALEKAGFRVTAVKDVLDAVVLLNELNPDLIVWDIQPRKLIEMKFLSVLRERYGSIPLLVVLSEVDVPYFPEEMADAMTLRPERIEQFVAKIRNFCEHQVKGVV